MPASNQLRMLPFVVTMTTSITVPHTRALDVSLQPDQTTLPAVLSFSIHYRAVYWEYYCKRKRAENNSYNTPGQFLRDLPL